MKVDLARIRELVSVVAESRVTELTVRGPEGTITVCRNMPQQPAANGATPVIVESNGSSAAEPPVSAPPAPEKIAVRSPAVGYLRLQLGTAANSKLEVGDLVNDQQLVCVVESMNVPMEVHAPCAGRLASIDVQAEQPVEYGQALMWIEPA
jgi:biotin carboxyl carrier protein